MKPTPKQIALVQVARRVNLLAMNTQWLSNMLLYLGAGTTGTREELIERLRKQIWLHAYDTEQ